VSKCCYLTCGLNDARILTPCVGKSRDDVSFLVIGDFGGLPAFPYKTAVEEAVAIQMGKYARNNTVDFVLTLGDNFYYDGVKNIKDPRFQVGD